MDQRTDDIIHGLIQSNQSLSTIVQAQHELITILKKYREEKINSSLDRTIKAELARYDDLLKLLTKQ